MEEEVTNLMKMKTMLFEISRVNCEALYSNPKSLYVIGIGDTDYTIHRESQEIFDWYTSQEPQYWYDIVDNKFSIVHYFSHNLKTILDEGVKRDTIQLSGNLYKILDIKIEIPNKVETKLIYTGRKNDYAEIKFNILTDNLTKYDKFWFNASLEELN